MNRSSTAAARPLNTLDYEGAVEKVRTHDAGKVVTLTGGLELEVPRASCVGLKDELRVTRRSGRLKAEALCENGVAVVLPSFRSTYVLPDLSGRLVVREARDSKDIDGYTRLASFHYRSHQSFGRKAILVAYLERGGAESLVGYIELSNTFAGHRSRNALLDSAFEDESGLSWARWDMTTRAKYLNAIVRISRCVVRPKFEAPESDLYVPRPSSIPRLIGTSQEFDLCFLKSQRTC